MQTVIDGKCTAASLLRDRSFFCAWNDVPATRMSTRTNKKYS